MTAIHNEDPADPSPHEPRVTDAYRCIAPACKPLGCSDCNCAVPADVYAALGRAFQDAERERQTKPPKWWTCQTHGDAQPNAWGCPECVREMRGELDVHDALIAEVFTIAQIGVLPDGDIVNTPTLLWAEGWMHRLTEKEQPK